MQNSLTLSSATYRNTQSNESNELYGPFESIADEIGYTGDPRNLPCAFFVTMNGYQEELIVY